MLMVAPSQENVKRCIKLMYQAVTLYIYIYIVVDR